MTGFLNLFGFMTALGGYAIFLGFLLTGQENIYQYISLGVATLYVLPVVLNHLGNREFVRFYFGAIIPLWLSAAILMVGGNFGQGIGSGANIIITALLFREQPRWRTTLIIYNILTFAIPSIYIGLREPFFLVSEAAGDEVAVYLICLVWISVVFLIYERRNRSLLSLQERELQSRKEDLEEFVYLTSHDMKAPVRNMMGMLDLLKEMVDEGEYEELRMLVEKLELSAANLNDMIHNILEVSKFSQADPETFERVELDQELQKALFNLQTDIQRKKARITFDELPGYPSNPGDFALVFQNLIQNALKYNESEVPDIRISFSEEVGNYRISVEDNGIGIREEDFGEIFKLFKRVHSGGDYTGTGLGLGLCKKIVEKYNGEIQVDSKVGQFTRFSILLPRQSSESVGQILVDPFREFIKVSE